MSSSDDKDRELLPDYRPSGRDHEGEGGQACGRCGCHWFRVYSACLGVLAAPYLATECQRCGHIATACEAE